MLSWLRRFQVSALWRFVSRNGSKPTPIQSAPSARQSLKRLSDAMDADEAEDRELAADVQALAGDPEACDELSDDLDISGVIWPDDFPRQQP